MTVEVLRNDWPDSLEASWKNLQSASGSSIFQTWEWVKTWWDHFGKNKESRILVIRDGSSVVGIAPLMVTKKLGLSFVQWMGTGISDRLGPLILRSHEKEVSKAILDFLQSQPRVDLHELPAESFFIKTAEEMNWLRLTQSKSLYLRLDPSWEANEEVVKKKIDFYLNHKLTKMKRQLGNVELQIAKIENLPQSMETLFSLHTIQWEARGLPGGFRDSNMKAFHQEWACLCAKGGWLRLYTLIVNGKVEATLYQFHYSGQVYDYASGFSQTVARYSPGNILLAYAIQYAIEEGCMVYDFLRGEEPYKHEWNPQVKEQVRLCHAKGIFRNLWYPWVRWRTKI